MNFLTQIFFVTSVRKDDREFGMFTVDLVKKLIQIFVVYSLYKTGQEFMGIQNTDKCFYVFTIICELFLEDIQMIYYDA